MLDILAIYFRYKYINVFIDNRSRNSYQFSKISLERRIIHLLTYTPPIDASLDRASGIL